MICLPDSLALGRLSPNPQARYEDIFQIEPFYIVSRVSICPWSPFFDYKITERHQDIYF